MFISLTTCLLRDDLAEASWAVELVKSLALISAMVRISWMLAYREMGCDEMESIVARCRKIFQKAHARRGRVDPSTPELPLWRIIGSWTVEATITVSKTARVA